MNLVSKGGTTFASIRTTLQAKVGLFQQQGGYLRRVLNTGGTVFLDVLSASVNFGGDWLQANQLADTNVVVTLDAMPDWYAAEETLSDHTETTLPEITFTETTTSGGDFPLGDRVRVVVDDDQAQDQRGLFWAFRGRNYSSATTAASAYEAEALTLGDTATRVAKVGASGGTVVTHGTLATYWLPVVNTNLSAGTYLTHQGTYRAFARVFSTSGTAVSARMVYDVGDLVYPTENAEVRLYDGGTFQILDLGELRLLPTPSGTHRWQGQLQFKGDAGAEAVSVDRVWICNTDESFGIDRAPAPTSVSTTSAPVARDGFSQTAGNIDTPKTAEVGGNWAETGKIAANGFVIETSGHTAQRTTPGDADVNSGAYATVGSSAATQAVQVDVKTSVNLGSNVQRYGAIARFVDSSNCVFAVWEPGMKGGGPGALGPAGIVYGGATGTDSGGFAVYKRVAGVTTLLDGVGSGYFQVTGIFYRLMVAIDAAGNWSLYWNTAPNTPVLLLSGQDSVLATGGTLASGKPGIYDAHASGTATTRNVDNFVSWAPTADAVIFASRSVELNTLGINRLDSGGTAYGPVTQVNYDLPRMPNRSSAGTVEFMAKASRGDMQVSNDPGIDDISARVFRRASFLRVN
jgi:hypothetical protein